GDASVGNVVGSIGITDESGGMALLVRSSFTNQNMSLFKRSGRVECHVKDFNLAQGSYSCVLFLSSGETEILDCIENAAEVVVEGGDFFGTGSPGLPSHCKVLTRAEWRVS
ncbi:MAG: ABC transporter ATP-binding protein, partial [Acidobacteriota bacterium]|nr:ABC transporter ATP-binding protein [Acidobacteriota bacterium]